MPKPLNPEVRRRLAAIKDELTHDPEGVGYTALGTDYVALVAALNQPHAYANPLPQPLVPAPYTIFEYLGVCGPEVAARIYQAGALKADIEQAVNARDAQTLSALFAVVIAVAGASFTAEAQATVQAMLAERVPDPHWQATLHKPSAIQRLALMGNTYASEVQQALTGA